MAFFQCIKIPEGFYDRISNDKNKTLKFQMYLGAGIGKEDRNDRYRYQGNTDVLSQGHLVLKSCGN